MATAHGVEIGLFHHFGVSQHHVARDSAEAKRVDLMPVHPLELERTAVYAIHPIFNLRTAKCRTEMTDVQDFPRPIPKQNTDRNERRRLRIPFREGAGAKHGINTPGR